MKALAAPHTEGEKHFMAILELLALKIVEGDHNLFRGGKEGPFLCT